MRQGLKNRIKFDPSNPPRMNNIKTDYLSKNSFNTRVKDTYCAPNGSCSNNRDASGNYIGVNQKQQQTQRKYYAPFRQPLKGYRKTSNCQDVIPGEGNSNCWSTTEIYKDTYAVLDPKESNCLDNGSISTSKIPLITGGISAAKSKSGNYTRTNKPLIRSGMQPNVAGKQNSGLSGIKTATKYSYSYRELINNRRKDTQIKKLSTQKPLSSTYMSNPKKMPGYGGDCCYTEGGGQTTYRYNNNKFATQGAVESSDRITRLKLDTIRGSRKCPEGQTTTYDSSCNGVYSTGNLQTSSRTKDWPKYTTKNNAQVKYTALFNANNTEPQYTQVNALARTRGSSGNKRYNTGKIIENGGSRCPTNCPSFLM